MVTSNKTEILPLTLPPSGTETEKSPLISVLCVDDTVSLTNIVCQYLESGGEMVADAANSVEDAINKMKYSSYDVIVTDYTIEDGGGNALIKNVREHNNQTPFVYFILQKTESLENEAKAYGDVTFIDKIWRDHSCQFSRLYREVKMAALKSSGKTDKRTADPIASCCREKGA